MLQHPFTVANNIEEGLLLLQILPDSHVKIQGKTRVIVELKNARIQI